MFGCVPRVLLYHQFEINVRPRTVASFSNMCEPAQTTPHAEGHYPYISQLVTKGVVLSAADIATQEQLPKRRNYYPRAGNPPQRQRRKYEAPKTTPYTVCRGQRRLLSDDVDTAGNVG